ncbi:MAG: hypothetical protein HC848_08490, partial [Limnobacter sp.]|nr:hypothetical protein [Limnobacter sp.]
MLVTTTSTEFRQAFANEVGLPGLEALDFLVNSVSLKHIDDVNQFVKDFLIIDTAENEENTVGYKIERICQSFDNCAETEARLARIQAQIEAFQALKACYEATRFSQQALERLDKKNLVGEHWIRTGLVINLHEKASSEQTHIERLNQELQTLRSSEHHASQRLEDIRAQLAQLQTGEIALLEQKMRTTRMQLQQTRELRQAYQNWIGKLHFKMPAHSNAFLDLHTRLKARLEELARHIEQLEQARLQTAIHASTLEAEAKNIETELTALKQSRGNLPANALFCRDAIAQELGLAHGTACRLIANS